MFSYYETENGLKKVIQCKIVYKMQSLTTE